MKSGRAGFSGNVDRVYRLWYSLPPRGSGYMCCWSTLRRSHENELAATSWKPDAGSINLRDKNVGLEPRLESLTVIGDQTMGTDQVEDCRNQASDCPI